LSILNVIYSDVEDVRSFRTYGNRMIISLPNESYKKLHERSATINRADRSKSHNIETNQELGRENSGRCLATWWHLAFYQSKFASTDNKQI
jgi:hypothetical protein